MKNTAFFRCDASLTHGSGHVMRSLCIANSLAKRGWDCRFISIPESPQIVPSLSEFKIYDPSYQPDYADLLVVDHYDLDATYETLARKWSKTIMVIDDLADRKHDCDILVDQTIGRDQKEYVHLVPNHCYSCCGKDFMILRDQFLELIEAAKLKRNQVDTVKNVLISYGSTNPHHIVQKTLTALSLFTKYSLNIEIILSSQAQGFDEICKISSKITSSGSHNVIVNADAQNVAQSMLDADLCIGGGGIMSWERACLGLPTLMIEIADNQKYLSQKLHDYNAVYLIGDIRSVSYHDINTAFDSVHNNGIFLKTMCKNAFSICDGRGTENICKIILKETSLNIV